MKLFGVDGSDDGESRGDGDGGVMAIAMLVVGMMVVVMEMIGVIMEKVVVMVMAMFVVVMLVMIVLAMVVVVMVILVVMVVVIVMLIVLAMVVVVVMDVRRTVASESALRSAGTLLSQVPASPQAPWPDGGPESLRSPCCGLAIYKTKNQISIFSYFLKSELHEYRYRLKEQESKSRRRQRSQADLMKDPREQARKTTAREN
ncbi:hypothetical protein PoB_006597900 [Plakobranchus ocellatus]|uniref:Uncharacterized protein n=1 Tax=Plakobranchus ocellatus TaxID=259542 RepID=A0AAV4D5L0_9GAST|nr:hypothetical protein PoB_006597900 [Plakobranchus ocellatus]